MLNRIRDRFGTAGLIVSIMALVLALAGGAFAASGGLNAKQKKQVRAIAKSFQGTGPAGANGTNGTNGAKGDTGARGADGTAGANGADGKTVRSGTTAPEGSVVGNTGDFYIRTTTSQIFGPKTGSGNTGWGSGTNLQGPQGDPGQDGTDGTDGADGSPWVVGAAPSGAVLKGTWTVHSSNAAANELIPLAISTSVPVSATGFGFYVAVADQNDPDNPAGCTGTADEPSASPAPGLVCIYEKTSTNLTAPSPIGVLTGAGGGNVYQAEATGAGLVDGIGTWAMTAP